MKQRKPRKPRNMMALAMHNMCKPKSLAPKKGIGSKYTRKGRKTSGPYLLVA